MKHILQLIAAIFVLSLTALNANAQITVTMTDGGIDTIPCNISNTFLDGYSGAYGNNLDQTFTVCVTQDSGLSVSFSFSAEEGGYFDIDPSDTLYIYDGDDVNAPLIATLNNTSAPFGAATGNTTLANESGCITFQLVTDGANTGQGFQGVINCNYSCQPIVPWFLTMPHIVPNDSSGSINICLGDTVVLNALVNFPMSASQGGPGYNQTIGNSTIEWFIFGEPTQTGNSITFVPDQRAGYFVDLLVTDTLGCFENVRTRIQVSTIPIFSETHFLGSDTICLGEIATAIAGVTTTDTVGVDPTQGNFLNGGLFGEALELPDGSGTLDDIYSTTITIGGFEPGDTITAGSNILSMCVSMEHSYLGDLEMWLSCPNGDSITIFNAYNGNSGAPGFIPGGFTGSLGTNFGIPGSGSNQGTCFEYCYSITTNEFGTLGSEFNTNTTQGAASPGIYLPEQSFDMFVGCPINGDWTLHVADSWPADDGWICEWGIVFDPSIDPNAESYEPIIEDSWWSSSSTIIINQGDTLIEVQPVAPGNSFYTFNIIDDFGCPYDTTIQLHTVPTLTSFADVTLCNDEYQLTAADYAILGEWTYTGPIGGTATFSPNQSAYAPNVSVNAYGDYEFIFTSDYCGQSDTIVVDFNPTPSPVVLTDQTICPGTDLVFDAANEDIGATYTWMPGGFHGQVLNLDSVTASGGIQVTVTNDCGTANGAATIDVHAASVTGPLEVCLAQEANLIATLTTSGGYWNYTGPTGAVATFTSDSLDNTPSISVDMPGAYQFVFTDDECAMERTWNVFFAPAPTVEITMDTNRICVEDDILLTYSINTDIYDDLHWNQFSTNSDTLVIAGTDSMAFNMLDTLFHVSASISNFCGTGTDEVVYQVIDCTLDVPTVFNPESNVPENQYFNIVALNLHAGNNVKIFDRWGRKCYDVDDYHLNPWTGDGATDGVYYWVLVRSGYEAETGYVHLVHGSN
jgi:subtilisin-like proprotein convertase family protein